MLFIGWIEEYHFISNINKHNGLLPILRIGTMSQPSACRVVDFRWCNTSQSNLIANHEHGKRTTKYGHSKLRRRSHYKPCSCILLEISEVGYMNCIEMEGSCARSVYSGPITNWDDLDGVWTGCCAGYFCCPKGCVHFDVDIPCTDAPSKIHVNGRLLSKFTGQEYIPVVTAQYETYK